MRDILSVHMLYKDMSIESLESFTSRDSDSLSREVLDHPSIEECVVLKTCNRMEVYTALERDTMESAREELKIIFQGEGASLRFYAGRDSIEHLMRVASGLDSMVVGEYEILGQVRFAYETAREKKYAGNSLQKLFSKAIFVGKKVRSETDISKGSVSVASSAIRMSETLLKGLDGKRVIVIGAGKMGTRIAKLLKKYRTKKIFITNKTYEKARNIAGIVGGEAVRFSEFKRLLPEADLIFCATSADDYIITKKDLELFSPDNTTELTMIDLGNPRNLDPELAENPGVRVLNIDHLKEVSQSYYELRKNEVNKAERIIKCELDLFLGKMSEHRADDILREIYRKCDTIKSRELERAIGCHNWEEKEKEIITHLADAIVNKILYLPTTILKRASRDEDIETLTWADKLYYVEDSGCIR